MPPDGTFVIVGGGLAGAKAAETLRAEGFQGRVVLVGDEARRPYERPPLSKGYLRGENTFDDAAVHAEGFYDAEGIELRTSTAAGAVDIGVREVTLSTGERLRYDRLLLATGAAPRHLDVPGAELDGVRYLRTVADSDALRSAISPGTRVVVVGGGWIGTEVAASARQLGAEVAIIEAASVPLEKALGRELGGLYRDLHAKHGVQLFLGAGIASMSGTGTSVQEVRLSDGGAVPADLVVVGTGVSPRTELAQAAGIALDNGVRVDEHLATSAPDVYAAGDLANAFHPLYGAPVRLEHWSAALNQGPAAAKNMMGQGTVYDRTPYFFSDQYDVGMEFRGWPAGAEQVVFRGSTEGWEFIAFWLRRGQVVAAMNVNVWDSGDKLEALVRARPIVEAARLQDEKVDLAELAQ